MSEKTTVTRVQLATTVSAEVSEIIEEYRWENRLKRSDVLSEALELWIETKGLRGKPADDEAVSPKAEKPAANAAKA